MSLIVQKFGGTSVANTQKVLEAARKAIRTSMRGHQVVMVLSAMGKHTDHLIDLAGQISDRPSAREMDMLLSTGEQVTIALMAIALESLGHKAVSMTGVQIGIHTDSSHTKARIRTIETERMEKALKEGKIVIAAGFQGVDERGNITTLGRGGSDTTAVALAAALGAAECEIYTDVDGVYTTDPRVLPEARQLPRISYDEMLEMASLGAGVMHSRAVEFGKKFNVPIHVRSSLSDAIGTLICSEPESTTVSVCGAVLAKNEARITVVGMPDKPGAAMRVFSRIAQAKVPTDMIVQNVSWEGVTDLSFTVQESDLANVLDIVRKAAEEIGAEGIESDSNVAKVSIVGLGMEYQPGVARKMFRALADKNINIAMIATGDIKISTLVSREQAQDALRAAHAAFALEKTPADSRKSGGGQPPGNASQGEAAKQEEGSQKTAIFNHYAHMEDIVIEAILLDMEQSRLTLNDVPDVPGLAADAFDRMANAGINVDMIVQSVGEDNMTDISLTVPRVQLALALNIAAAIAAERGGHEPTHSDKVAKLTVRGTGLRSHTDLAFRMFKTLSDAGINVSIISTSERSVSVVVQHEDGEKGRQLLKTEFAAQMI